MASFNFAVAQTDYTGTYKGTMDEVMMNDNHYNDVTGQEFSLTAAKLSATVKQFGKMPGTININQSITINNGILTPANNDCGSLKIGLLRFKLILESLTDAKVTKNADGTQTLEFTMVCNGLYSGSNIRAHIHFKGNK